MMSEPKVWLPEEDRPYLDDMRPRDIWQELLDDAKILHATHIGRFVFAIAILSKKWKKHPDSLIRDLDAEAKAVNGLGLPFEPPERFAPH